MHVRNTLNSIHSMALGKPIMGRLVGVLGSLRTSNGWKKGNVNAAMAKNQSVLISVGGDAASASLNKLTRLETLAEHAKHWNHQQLLKTPDLSPRFAPFAHNVNFFQRNVLLDQITDPNATFLDSLSTIVSNPDLAEFAYSLLDPECDIQLEAREAPLGYGFYGILVSPSGESGMDSFCSKHITVLGALPEAVHIDVGGASSSARAGGDHGGCYALKDKHLELFTPALVLDSLSTAGKSSLYINNEQESLNYLEALSGTAHILASGLRCAMDFLEIAVPQSISDVELTAFALKAIRDEIVTVSELCRDEKGGMPGGMKYVLDTLEKDINRELSQQAHQGEFVRALTEAVGTPDIDDPRLMASINAWKATESSTGSSRFKVKFKMDPSIKAVFDAQKVRKPTPK